MADGHDVDGPDEAALVEILTGLNQPAIGYTPEELEGLLDVLDGSDAPW